MYEIVLLFVKTSVESRRETPWYHDTVRDSTASPVGSFRFDGIGRSKTEGNDVHACRGLQRERSEAWTVRFDRRTWCAGRCYAHHPPHPWRCWACSPGTDEPPVPSIPLDWLRGLWCWSDDRWPWLAFWSLDLILFCWIFLLHFFELLLSLLISFFVRKPAHIVEVNSHPSHRFWTSAKKSWTVFAGRTKLSPVTMTQGVGLNTHRLLW